MFCRNWVFEKIDFFGFQICLYIFRNIFYKSHFSQHRPPTYRDLLSRIPPHILTRLWKPCCISEFILLKRVLDLGARMLHRGYGTQHTGFCIYGKCFSIFLCYIFSLNFGRNWPMSKVNIFAYFDIKVVLSTFLNKEKNGSQDTYVRLPVLAFESVLLKAGNHQRQLLELMGEGNPHKPPCC